MPRCPREHTKSKRSNRKNQWIAGNQCNNMEGHTKTSYKNKDTTVPIQNNASSIYDRRQMEWHTKL